MWAGLSSGAQKENLFPAPVLASGGCLRSLAFLGLCQHCSNLPPLSRGILPVSVSKCSSSYKDTSHWIWSPL